MCIRDRDREALAVAFLEVHHAGGYHGKGNSPDIPLNTITTSGGISVNMAHVIKFKGNDIGQHPQDPLHTVTTLSLIHISTTMLAKWLGVW